LPCLFDQKQPDGDYVILLRLAQAVVPFGELVGMLDAPNHQTQDMPSME
jgi:hypothetical protein